MDAFRREDQSGLVWKDNPEEYGRTADPNGLALHCLHQIYEALPTGREQPFRHWMHRVFNVETAGRQHIAQEMPRQVPGEETLWQLTAEKGGCSVLLFRSVLAHPLSIQEQEALFQWGAVVQLCDDIFDIWFDRQAGIVTLPLTLLEKGDVKALEAFFNAQVEQCYRLFQGLYTSLPTVPAPYGRFKVETARSAVSFLIALTRVCLRHYEDMGRFGALPLDDRTKMVVDMERWGNRLRAARAVVKEQLLQIAPIRQRL